MRTVRPWLEQIEEEQREADRQTASLAGLAVALLLVVIGLFLVNVLRDKARLEDCMLAGRADCAPIVVLEAMR